MDGLSEECTPSRKRKLTFWENKCCFCEKTFKHNKTTLNPAKLDALLSVCNNQSDELSVNILANQDKIKNGEIKLVYHKACRSKYVHPFYTTATGNQTTKESCPKLTRSLLKSEEFSWREKCFICSQSCSSEHRYKWSKVEGSIDENSKLYSQLLKLSVEKGDHALHSRLLSCKGDLVAVEARYHRKKSCLANYLSQKNGPEETKSTFEVVCESLKSEIYESVETYKQVYDLSQIKSRVQELGALQKLDIDMSKVTGKEVKKMLTRVWPELKFIARKGMSDLICSNNLSVDDALRKTVVLEKNLRDADEQSSIECSFSEPFESSENRELAVIHEAAAILRKRLLKVTVPKNEYFSPGEISVESQEEFIDHHLLLFIKWLKGYADKTDTNELTLDQNEVSVCSDITYLVKPVTTPKHLGLSVYLHHSYGSKKLIEDLHAHGYTLAYSEVRHFLTSAAHHMASMQLQTTSGGLVPTQLVRPDTANGSLIIAAADNWDHNENTLSGKRTTHAMTSMLVQTSKGEERLQSRISRVPERSVEVSSLPGKGLAHTLTYVKPDKRPCPVLTLPVEVDELHEPHEPDAARLLRLKELMYTVGRQHTLASMCDDRAVPSSVYPSWTVFQSCLQNDLVLASTIESVYYRFLSVSV